MSRILLVEKGRDMAAMLLEGLQRAGHQVEHIGDAAQAVDRILTSPPALTLLDTALPRYDGLRVLEKVRPHSDHPIIVLTARTREADRLRGLDLGADDYVCKPFSPREVVARVNMVLRRHAQRHRTAMPSPSVAFGDLSGGVRIEAARWRSPAANCGCCRRFRANRGACSHALRCWKPHFRKRST